MCFSPEMDLAAGVVVGGIAVQAARSVRDPSQWPLAAIPAVLAVHQLIEAAVWWGAEGRLPSDVGQAATLAYLGIAFVVVPVLVPAAVTMLEPPPRRDGDEADGPAGRRLGPGARLVVGHPAVHGAGREVPSRLPRPCRRRGRGRRPLRGGHLRSTAAVQPPGPALVGGAERARDRAARLAPAVGVHLAVVRLGGAVQRRGADLPAADERPEGTTGRQTSAFPASRPATGGDG